MICVLKAGATPEVPVKKIPLVTNTDEVAQTRESSKGCARLITSLSYRILCFAVLALELWTAHTNALSKDLASSG